MISAKWTESAITNVLKTETNMDTRFSFDESYKITNARSNNIAFKQDIIAKARADVS
jgi:hypothetical protein